MLKSQLDFRTAPDSEKQEIASVVHLLRDQACTLALGISALQYEDEEQERQQYVAVLESVVDEMNRQFQRLDQCLMQVGYKPAFGEPASGLRRGRRMRKHSAGG